MQAFFRFIVGLALASTVAPSFAGTYPDRPVRLIVPYAVGQGTDIAARYVAEELGKVLGQPIVVDNRPGAGGNVGTQIAARSTADGYTLLIGTNATHAANAYLFLQPGFDPQADFQPVAMVGVLPLVFVTAPANPVNGIADLVRSARAQPGKLNIAISTTTCRVAFELFRQRADATLFPVDYKGSAQALTAVLSGQVDYMVDTIASLRGPVQSGQVKALGVTSAQATRLLPGVKSVAEQGVEGYELVGWTVLYAPKGLPPDTSRILAAAVQKTLSQKSMQDKLLELGIEPVDKSGPALDSFVASEKEKWGRLIRDAGLKPG
jgi:tripartite-type tricarboxylate transporter receptor subunit TctC